MNKDLQYIEQIEQYLAGDLNPEMKTEFEKRLKEDPNFRDDFDVTTRLIQGIRGYAFKKMLIDLHQKHFGDASKDAGI